MSEEAGDKAAASSQDKDLNDLLDKALEDFDNPITVKPGDETSKDGKGEKSEVVPAEGEVPPDNIWTEEFIKKAAEQFESHMAGIFGAAGLPPLSEEELDNSIKQKLAEAAAYTMQPENIANMPPVENEFASTIAETLRGLSTGAENLQMPFSPDDLMSMFGNLSTDESGSENGFIPIMQTMMQSLLSAEVLLPSMQDLKSKYPKWIEDHKSDTPSEDLERFEKQHQLILEVCTELEKETPADTPEVKKERFVKVFELMQKMQDLGQPPLELVGDLNLPPELDQGQLPAMADPSQCIVM